MEGRGTYRFADGSVYVGDYRNGKREGRGVYRFSDGAVYEGEYKAGAMEGFGTYQYVDGRAEVGRYAGNVDVGEGVRWSADRTTAWRLMDGKVVEEITLETADRIARKIGQSLRQESHKSAGSGGGMDRYGGGGGKPSSAGGSGRRSAASSASGFGGGAKAAGMGIHAPLGGFGGHGGAFAAPNAGAANVGAPTRSSRNSGSGASGRSTASGGSNRPGSSAAAVGYAHKGFGSLAAARNPHSVVHGSSGSPRHAQWEAWASAAPAPAIPWGE